MDSVGECLGFNTEYRKNRSYSKFSALLRKTDRLCFRRGAVCCRLCWKVVPSDSRTVSRQRTARHFTSLERLPCLHRQFGPCGGI